MFFSVLTKKMQVKFANVLQIGKMDINVGR